MTPSVPAPAGEAPAPDALSNPEWADYPVVVRAYLAIETALARRILADRNAARAAPHDWPAGQSWDELGQTSHETFWRNARIEAGLPQESSFKNDVILGASGAPGRDAPSEATIYPRGPLARELSQLAETLGDAVASVTNLGVSAKRIPRESVENIRKVWLRLVEIVTELESEASRGLPAPLEPVSDALALIRRALAMRDYGDKPVLWEQVWLDIKGAADVLGRALAVGSEPVGGLPAAPPDGPLSVAQLANILNTQGSPISAGASVGPVNERGWFIGESDLRYLIYALPRVARTALGEGRPE